MAATKSLPAIRCTSVITWRALIWRVPRFLRRGLVEPMVNLLPVKTKNLSFDYRARRFIAASHYDEVARHHVLFGSFTPDDQESLLTEEVKRASDADIYGDARRMFAECDSNNSIECMQNLDTQLYLAEDILTKVDRASMAVSLEVRAPYLDPRVAEFAASLPPRYKLHGYTSKYILKKAAKGLVPPFVWRRGKKGFGVPFAQMAEERIASVDARSVVAGASASHRIVQSGICRAASEMNTSAASPIIASCFGLCFRSSCGARVLSRRRRGSRRR